MRHERDMHAIRKLDKQLGVGAHGAVYEGYDEEHGCFVAIKELPYTGHVHKSNKDNSSSNKDKSSSSSNAYDEEGGEAAVAAAIMREIRVMQRAAHPNLVRYLGVRRSGVYVQLIMEYVAGGSLERLLARCGRVREQAARAYTRDILAGLHYLHTTLHVCHRDVKPGNVLLTVDGHCKLTDFGVARALSEPHSEDKDSSGSSSGGSACYMHTMAGTPWYMAPEVIGDGCVEDDDDDDDNGNKDSDAQDGTNDDNDGDEHEDNTATHASSSSSSLLLRSSCRAGQGYTTRADIWSLGVTVYEMVSGRRPFAADIRNPTTALFAIAKHAAQPPPLPRSCGASAALRSFVALCLIHDPALRPSAAELLTHRWLRGDADEHDDNNDSVCNSSAHVSNKDSDEDGDVLHSCSSSSSARHDGASSAGRSSDTPLPRTSNTTAWRARHEHACRDGGGADNNSSSSSGLAHATPLDMMDIAASSLSTPTTTATQLSARASPSRNNDAARRVTRPHSIATTTAHATPPPPPSSATAAAAVAATHPAVAAAAIRRVSVVSVHSDGAFCTHDGHLVDL